MKDDPFAKPRAPFSGFKSASISSLARLFVSPTRWKTMAVPEGERGAPESSRIRKLRLAPDDGVVPSFKPGQFAFLSFPGRGLLASPRPFSIASSPAENRWIEFLVKDTGDWSGAAGRLEPLSGAKLWGPFGRFSYLDARGSGRFVFLAAGIGGAPFLSMLRYMADADRGARVLFLWGARTRDDLAEAPELARVAELVPGFRFVPVLSHDPRWAGERGRIDEEKLSRLVPAFFGSDRERFEWNSASFRLCGPRPFRKDLRAALRRLGATDAVLHEQSFEW